MIIVWNKGGDKLLGVYRDWDGKCVGPNMVNYFLHVVGCDYEHWKKYHLHEKGIQKECLE